MGTIRMSPLMAACLLAAQVVVMGAPAWDGGDYTPEGDGTLTVMDQTRVNMEADASDPTSVLSADGDIRYHEEKNIEEVSSKPKTTSPPSIGYIQDVPPQSMIDLIVVIPTVRRFKSDGTI